MISKEKPSPGKLISLRGREWVVLPTDDEDILKVKPLGGSDDESTGIYLPLMISEDQWKEASFPRPESEDLGDFETAKLLFEASRLSFRNASGPFRAMGKLSFRPRSYQIVPLVMALKQDVVRLLIADDVGIGKTVEALIILREQIERGEVKRFAVICQPHLCEQWHKELKDKLDIDAEIIRSSTVSALERKLTGSESIFKAFPYQVISIDYIKSDRRKPIFLNDCPEFIIVDEAHTATKPAGASSPSQQQRYHLLHDLAKDQNRHILLLTATPHSGKDEEFQSLLGLLKPDFEKINLEDFDKKRRQELSNYFIQRKREQIRKWLSEETPFPDRDTKEIGYKLSPDYIQFFKEAQSFARGLTQGAEHHKGLKGKYWAALALLRGIMSSPAAGLEMLKGKIQRSEENAPEIIYEENPVIERIEEDTDSTQMELLNQAGLEDSEIEILKSLAADLEQLANLKQDRKAANALSIVKEWIRDGFHPIIFCKYIATAKYLEGIFRDNLPKSIEVQAITSELPDEQRKEHIEAMEKSERRVLIATDCLSEGINLQKGFNAVLHYDLPWNPNRLEQREGRVDRYGQNSPEVKTWLLWGEDNPIDAIVLKVLIRKVRDIQKSTGVSISLGEDNRSIMDAVLNEVLLDPQKALEKSQISLDFGSDFQESIITRELEAAKLKAQNLISIFAHMSVPQEEIEDDLKKVDEAIGDIQSVETLVLNGIVHLKGSYQKEANGYRILLQNLPPHLREALGTKSDYRVSFYSPTPEGYQYIGRNHKFTEQLCQYLLSLAFEQKADFDQVARAAVIQTSSIKTQTTIIQFRVRNVIKEVKSKVENISEEMYLWGFEGLSDGGDILDYASCKKLLFEAESAQNLSKERQVDTFNHQMSLFQGRLEEFIEIAEERSVQLVEAHGRFKKLVGGKRYEAVHPILPPDILGVYVFLPTPVQFVMN
ncbi:helicase-related protein [Algoriphagus aquimarinus]|uniref:SNF2 family N-terminal domain-containing protein n=1 Tax=Algoriphagus aquimarinus TaxID=237018 RepID=A0A1I1CAX4_9BACT|nr:helicase-related protein [Algoriphagus aquimarinus]SFB59809.1 SNF2 family N-terminal domain-containing protein [Algoriphagus aquimarinus]